MGRARKAEFSPPRDGIDQSRARSEPARRARARSAGRNIMSEPLSAEGYVEALDLPDAGPALNPWAA